MGIEELKPLLNSTTFPILIANIDEETSAKLGNYDQVKKSTIYKINGVSIGIIGYLTPETKAASNTNIELSDEVEAIK